MDLEPIVGKWASKAKPPFYWGVMLSILWWNISPVVCDALLIDCKQYRAWLQLASGLFIVGGLFLSLLRGVKRRSWFDY